MSDVKTTALVWISPSTWPACVDAARDRAADDHVVLLHVGDDRIAAEAHRAYAGLLGRGHGPERDPGSRLEALSGVAGADLLEEAAHRLGRPCELLDRHGRPQEEVVRAAADVDLLDLRTRRRPRQTGSTQPRTGVPLRGRPRAVPGPAGVAAPELSGGTERPGGTIPA